MGGGGGPSRNQQYARLLHYLCVSIMFDESQRGTHYGIISVPTKTPKKIHIYGTSVVGRCVVVEREGSGQLQSGRCVDARSTCASSTDQGFGSDR